MKIIRFWFPVFLYSGIIFLISAVPNLKTFPGIPFLDKGFHFAEYIPLGLLTAWALTHTMRNPQKTQVFYLALVISLLFGLSDEVHQIFVPGRSFSIFDWMADGIGSCLGGALYLRCRR